MYQIVINYMEQLLASCPKCRGRNFFYDKYDVPITVLKERVWLFCKDCGYKTELEEFKNSLFSA